MPKQFIKQVTVTGADDSIDPIELYKITDTYPFIEWGILLSKSSVGNPRFPSYNWLGELLKLHNCYSNICRVSLSGHLCGRWVRDICSGGVEFYSDMSDIIPIFQRFQLNFHSYLHRINSTDNFIKALKSVSVQKQQIIFQFDDVNNELLRTAKENGVDAVPLFDLSGGAGVLPKEWKEPVGNYCGYAGGLSPTNLERQLNIITEKVNGISIWIDAETHLRSNNDRQFDINKVIKFAEIAKPFIINSINMNYGVKDEYTDRGNK